MRLERKEEGRKIGPDGLPEDFTDQVMQRIYWEMLKERYMKRLRSNSDQIKDN